MGKAFGLAAILVALYVAMTLYGEVIQGALGGALAPIEPRSSRDGSAAASLTPAAQFDSGPTDRERRVWVTDVVRDKVATDLRAGAERRQR